MMRPDRPTGHRTGMLVAVLGLVLLAAAPPATASGPPATAATRPTTMSTAATAEDTSGRTMLVLDSSGSMAERAAGGDTKIEAARQALGQLIGGLPESQRVGLRVYGATVFAQDDAGACTDSQQVVAPGTDNRDELAAAVASYEPYGETPIGYALEQAASDLGSEGERTIVLVSDGEATCPPAPCDVAAEIVQQGIDVRIDVVGLDVSGRAREQLRCVAEAGQGTYYDADSADELAKSLDRSTRPARPFGFEGTPVEGTSDEAGAPTIGAGGWTDSLGATGSDTDVRTYLVERTMPNSTLHVSASLLGDGDDTDALVVGAWEPGQALQGEDCDGQQAIRAGTGAALLSTGVTVGPHTTFDQSRTCRTGKEIAVTVSRGNHDGEYGGDADLPMALYVIEEPPVAGVDDLPEQAE